MNTSLNQSSAVSLPAVTELEGRFLVKTLNYDTVEQQLGDNYSNAGSAEAAALFTHDSYAAKLHAAGGLLTSLKKKGLGHHDREYDQFCLTELGVRTAFAYKASAGK